MSVQAPPRASCRRRLHEMTEENTYVTRTGVRKCRECIRIADRRRHRRHREARNALSRRLYRARGPQQRRDRNLQEKFGLSHADYLALLEAQESKCAICADSDPGGRWNTHFMVDHDHDTGVVRGLLCGHCNVMLGNAHDDPVRLRAAARYLEVTAGDV